MKTWAKVLIGIAIALVVLFVVAYFGVGYVIYDKLGNVKGSCDERLTNRPDNFSLHPESISVRASSWPRPHKRPA
jgi:hypothetical protein